MQSQDTKSSSAAPQPHTAQHGPTIGQVCANPPGRDDRRNLNGEFVDVVVGRSGDLSSVTLQHLAAPGTDHSRFENLLTFPSGVRFAPGTAVRVHCGSGKNGPDAHGRFHWFLADEHGRGRYALNNTGDIVRLLDSHGQELVRRVLSGRECEDQPRGPSVIVPPTVPVRAFGQGPK